MFLLIAQANAQTQMPDQALSETVLVSSESIPIGSSFYYSNEALSSPATIEDIRVIQSLSLSSLEPQVTVLQMTIWRNGANGIQISETLLITPECEVSYGERYGLQITTLNGSKQWLLLPKDFQKKLCAQIQKITPVNHRVDPKE